MKKAVASASDGFAFQIGLIGHIARLREDGARPSPNLRELIRRMPLTGG